MLGAGEILLTSMDTDGVQTGFDCALTHAVSQATHIPVIASGGAGKPEDFGEVLDRGLRRCRARRLHLSLRHLHGGDLKDHLHLRNVPVRPAHEMMIIPCIDLMDGKVVQLVQGREKALEGDAPLEMLREVRGFPGDSGDRSRRGDGQGSNDALVELLASRAVAASAAASARPIGRARLIDQGAYRVIVGTAAFDRPDA